MKRLILRVRVAGPPLTPAASRTARNDRRSPIHSEALRSVWLRAVTVVVFVLVLIEAWWLAVAVIGPDPVWSLGMDARYYADLGVRWLADETFYQPFQLAGPYQATLLGQGPAPVTLYPPAALFLFVPFAFLPLALWWVIPLTVTGAALYRMRPAPWAWPVMLALFLWPRAIGAYLFGNTDMWMAAGLAAGLMWGWPAVALTLKPTLLPFALIGIRRRSWWLVTGIGLVAVALSLPLWLDYATAMRNVRGLDLTYSLDALPLLAIPVVAWLSRAAAPGAPWSWRSARHRADGLAPLP